ncbi:hypothetical protein ACH5RR_041063 [Cinchona calisaya]|uniref:Uncharacterized protein n=1 Tax=Cinchona calisaya TaxID=153742 RepID=A0ABD2XUE7_9GENT
MSTQAKIDPKEEDEEQCFASAMQLVTGAWVPLVLNAVVRLDVLEIIAKAGPGAQLSPSEIASQISTKNPDAAITLDRMLALLASYSVLTCSVVDAGAGAQYERRYGLAPVAKYLVKQQFGAPLRPLLEYLLDKEMMDSWYGLEAAVLEGGTAFEKTHGAPVFKYIAKDPRLMNASNIAMTNYTDLYLTKLLDCYKGFDDVKILVDVGGALGQALGMITSKYPNIKGINFDLPHVIERAPSYPGVEHKAGDMFESVPEGDAMFMKWILHLFDDDRCLKLLKNCYNALPDNGKLMIVESILPVNPENSDAAMKSNIQIDLLRVAMSTGPKERSEIEYQALATKAGFKGLRFECLVFNLWVMVLYK